IGFSALVDLQAVENSIKAYIVVDADPNKLDDIANSIGENMNVLSLYRRRGKNQIIAETLFLNLGSIEDFESFISKLTGVKNFETMIVSKAYRKNPWIGI
ncbi:MAG: Lrp/AsnC family transcriptional regulator, partial [Thermoplasmata archaeon]